MLELHLRRRVARAAAARAGPADARAGPSSRSSSGRRGCRCRRGSGRSRSRGPSTRRCSGTGPPRRPCGGSAPWISFLTSRYWESALGARTFIHEGRRGRSATGSERSIASECTDEIAGLEALPGIQIDVVDLERRVHCAEAERDGLGAEQTGDVAQEHPDARVRAATRPKEPPSRRRGRSGPRGGSGRPRRPRVGRRGVPLPRTKNLACQSPKAKHAGRRGRRAAGRQVERARAAVPLDPEGLVARADGCASAQSPGRCAGLERTTRHEQVVRDCPPRPRRDATPSASQPEAAPVPISPPSADGAVSGCRCGERRESRDQRTMSVPAAITHSQVDSDLRASACPVRVSWAVLDPSIE